MTIHQIIRDRLHQRAGLVERKKGIGKTLQQLSLTEWSPEFERLMRNRMIMGALRYGTMENKKKGTKRWDLIGAITRKIDLYNSTGNTEYLVDIANYCLIAFEVDAHPKKHFHALDDHHDHCKEISKDIK